MMGFEYSLNMNIYGKLLVGARILRIKNMNIKTEFEIKLE